MIKPQAFNKWFAGSRYENCQARRPLDTGVSDASHRSDRMPETFSRRCVKFGPVRNQRT